MSNESISLRFSILNDTGIKYIETHSTTTTENGIVTLNLGDGTATFQTYENVNWKLANLSLKVEVNNGAGFVDMGTSSFNAVPYALEILNPVFEKDGDDAYKEIGNVGIGTDEPLENLHINDADDAALLLTTAQQSGSTSIRLENGLAINSHTHFNIFNDNNELSISRETALFNGANITALKLNQQLGLEVPFGLKLGTGAYIEEFSNGFIALENSPTKVPTQQAVKGFVEQSIMISENRSVEKKLHLPFTAFEYQIVNNNSSFNATYDSRGVLLRSDLIAPLLLPAGATVTLIKFYLRDNEGGSGIYIQLIEKSFIDAATPIQVYETQPSRNQPDVFIDTTTTNITIDANSYYYFDVKYSNGPSVDMAIIGAEIIYTE